MGRGSACKHLSHLLIAFVVARYQSPVWRQGMLNMRSTDLLVC